MIVKKTLKRPKHSNRITIAPNTPETPQEDEENL